MFWQKFKTKTWISADRKYTPSEREYGQKAGGMGRGFVKEPSNDDYKNNKQTTAKVHQLPQSQCILRVVNTYTFSQNGCQTKVTSLKGQTLAKFQYMLYVHVSVCIWPWVFPSIIFVRCYFYDFVLHFPFVLVILLHFCARINSSKKGEGAELEQGEVVKLFPQTSLPLLPNVMENCCV